MIAKFKNSIYKVAELVGLEAKFLADGTVAWSMVHLKKEKEEILLAAAKINSDTLEACTALIPKDVPVVLSFSGKGIICKKAPVSEAGLEAALGALVPNANLEEFAYDTEEQGDQWFVALIRKSRLEPIIAQLEAQKIQVIGASLEFMPLLRFQSVLGMSMSDFVVNGYLLKYGKDGLEDFTPSANATEALVVGRSTIAAEQVLPYTAAFVQMLFPQDAKSINIPALQGAHSEFLEKKIFKFALVGTLVAILVLLIGNALAFTNQFSKNEDLKQQSYRFKGKTDDIKKEELAVLEKENFLKQNGWLHKSKLSFMCDKLAATVPSSITLKDFDINPIKVDNTAAVKKSFFIDKKLNLRGRCYKSSDLSNWIQILKNLNWISDVQMVDYTFDHSNNSAVFNLEITYNIE